MPPPDPDAPTPPADWMARAAEVLPTEHFTLQAARATATADANGRATMYLMTLSSSLVALGFIGQSSELGTPFFVFALVLLPTLFLLGVATVIRMTQSSSEEFDLSRGVNRIRRFYLDYAPETAPYIILSAADDDTGALYNMRVKKTGGRQGWLQFFLTMPATLGIVNSVVGGVAVGLAVALLDPSLGVSVTAGALAFVASAAAHVRIEQAIFSGGVPVEVHFPSEPDADTAHPPG